MTGGTMPQATDFTSITQGPNGQYGVMVNRLPKTPAPGKEPVEKPPVCVSGFTLTYEEAQLVELAISEAMIDFRATRNEWEEG